MEEIQSLEEFSQEFMSYVKENAIDNQCSIENQLTDDVIDYIKEEGTAFNPTIVSWENKAKTSDSDFFKINAFDYSEDTGYLDLFVTSYIESENIPEFTSKRIETAINSIMHFVTNCVTKTDFVKEVADELDLAEVVEVVKSEILSGRVSLVRFFLITNALKKVDYNFPSIMTLQEKDFDCEFYVWDIETIKKSDVAARCDGAIDIDFSSIYPSAIQCLELEELNGVKSYLAIMPAIILAQVFGEYKARLLNQNVRNYLGGKIKVNKGMAETLRKTPGLFFAYNNGISSTASKVITKIVDGKLAITNVRNWQIVNGGQTTNTIFNVYKGDKEILQSAFVTMKVSEINIEDEYKKGESISNIAKFANSQTQIKDSDLSANITYMTQLEEFSRSEKTPLNSAGKGTYWFFERMRGQYENMKGEKKKSKRNGGFEALNPKGQRFYKTDVAKWEMAWDGFPHSASKGGEQCYDSFYKDYLKKDAFVVDLNYYKRLIAKAVIYKEIEKLNKEAGIKAYRNIIANYVLAILAVKSHGRLDLDYVWERQTVQPALIDFLNKASEIVNIYISSLTRRGDNPTVKAKNQAFWNDIQLRLAVLPDLDRSVLEVKNSNVLTQEQINRINEFKQTNVDWKKLLEWGKTTRNLSLLERKRIERLIIDLEHNKDIDYKVANDALNIYSKSEDLGF
ncbi:MAG: AIPR family protein [Paludibacteraceae bacterium]|nr:AIPR family protein [Paludibacteraceae bacterium]